MQADGVREERTRGLVSWKDALYGPTAPGDGVFNVRAVAPAGFFVHEVLSDYGSTTLTRCASFGPQFEELGVSLCLKHFALRRPVFRVVAYAGEVVARGNELSAEAEESLKSVLRRWVGV